MVLKSIVPSTRYQFLRRPNTEMALDYSSPQVAVMALTHSSSATTPDAPRTDMERYEILDHSSVALASMPATISGERPTRDLDKRRDIRIDLAQDAPNNVKENRMSQAVTAQDWTGDDDPENPENWPLGQRVWGTLVPGIISFAV